MINTAVVGFGMSGKLFHAPFIHAHKSFALKKVVERHTENARSIYPDIEIIRDYKQLFTDDSIELVVISTPNIFHFEMAKACLESGKHIVVEKPFMPTSAEANEIIKLAKANNLHVFVYHNRRWDGDFLTIKKLLKSKLIGDIQYFEAHFDQYRPERKRAAWRDDVLPGSGILYDLGSHLIDQVLQLFGKPLTLKAHIEQQRPDSKVDDFFEFEFTYPEHKAVVTAGMLVEDHELRYVINGSTGSYIKYGVDPQEDALKNGFLPMGDEWGTETFENWGFANFIKNELWFDGSIETIAGNYMDFYENVYNVLRNNAEQMVKPEEARDVISMIEIAKNSSTEKMIIEL